MNNNGKRGLGRGLEALFSVFDEENEKMLAPLKMKQEQL